MNGSKYGLDNSVYLSYARRADKTLINRLIDVAASDEIYQSGIDDAGEVKERQPVDVAIRIDEEHLSFGESIKEFMDEIATSRRALFVISDEYFRSPYCMYECVSAYNAINPLKPKADVKPFYPAAVFVEDGKTKDDAILVFKKDGCPSLCVEKFIDHWKKELQGCSDASHAPYWYQKYIDMIEELECWLIGRRFLIDPDSLLPVFSVESQCDDSQIIKYIRRARNPIENEYALPSRDKLLASTTTDFCNVLAGLPENSKMFNRGNEFGSGDEILSYVTGVLRGDVAEFVKKDLVRILESASVLDNSERNKVRIQVEAVFRMLVKHGILRDTLHHRLQEMNQKRDGFSPYTVSEESQLPEMVTSSITGRPAAFRKVHAGGAGHDYCYIGEKELAINGNDYLESGEQIADIKEELIFGVFNSQYDSAGNKKPQQRQPGKKALKFLVNDQLKKDSANSFIVKIVGLSEKDANSLSKLLNSQNLLKNVPVFIHVSGQENVIEMEPPWYNAIDAYYRAQEVLSEKSM